MGIRRGEILTPIIADGLLTNFDASNLASTIPSSATTVITNTANLSNSGTFSDAGSYDATNKCFNWDDIDDNFQLDSAIDLGKEYTYCAWINPTAWSGEPIGGSAVSNAYFMFLVNGTSMYHSPLWGTTNVTINHGLSLSTWVYFSLTRKDTSVIVYQNGVQYATGTLQSNTNSLTVRNFGTETGANYFYGGKQDNMNLYNRRLSPTEILHNYNALKDRH